MKAQHAPETTTALDVYLVKDKERLFCKRYFREDAAYRAVKSLDDRFASFGWSAEIEKVTIGKQGRTLCYGGHNAGTPPKEQGNPPA